MKTQKSAYNIFLILGQKACLFLIVISLSSHLGLAQETVESTEEVEETFIRPQQSDSNSERLRLNYLVASGGLNAHQQLQAVKATGTVKISTQTKNFELIETKDGRRRIIYSWKHLGREYMEAYIYDGSVTWMQKMKPEQQTPKAYSGLNAIHFAHQHWLLHPFTPPSLADYVFQYQGTALVGGRDAFLIVGYGQKNQASWFYFDKESSLLIRWGGKGQIAGVKEDMDYLATRFEPVSGVILPQSINLIAENSVYGVINFISITANPDLSEVSFTQPASTTPVLRQRFVSPN